MPKTKAALKSAQTVKQKQKTKLKTEQKMKMTAPAQGNAKPKPNPEIPTSTPNAKTTRASKLNEERSSDIRGSKKNEESTTNPASSDRGTTQANPSPEITKPVYPRPLVIWHKKPSRKKRSGTASSKKVAEPMPMSNPTPTPAPISEKKSKTNTTSARGNARPQPIPETPKPVYPRPLVIWHKKPSKKRSSKTTSLKEDAISTSNATPTPASKQKLNTSSVRRTTQPRSSPEITKPNLKATPKAKSTRNSKLNVDTRSKTANSKTAARVVIEISDSDSDDDNDIDDVDADVDIEDEDEDGYMDEDMDDDTNIDEILTAKKAARIFIEISDSDEDDDSDDDDNDGDGDEEIDVDTNTDVDVDVDVDADFEEDIDVDANATPQSTSIHSPKPDATPDIIGSIPNFTVAPSPPHLGDLDLLSLFSEAEPEPASGFENPIAGDGDLDADANADEIPEYIPMYSPTLDATSDIGLIPEMITGMASPYLGDLDLMPSVLEAEPESVSGLGNSMLDAPSNIMGLLPNANAVLASPCQRDPMLSVPEVEIEPASGLRTQVAGDGSHLAPDLQMYVNRDVEMGIDMNTDMLMDVSISTETNTTPFQTSWEGMYMDPPLTAEEWGFDFSNIGVEEIDVLFGEMEREKDKDIRGNVDADVVADAHVEMQGDVEMGADAEMGESQGARVDFEAQNEQEQAQAQELAQAQTPTQAPKQKKKQQKRKAEEEQGWGGRLRKRTRD
ncbi:hypothetical protein BPOR_0107g00130 [Botrytis porri]|uniref:Uncharacterized protein n=1 Tax=Botrytis porri TaxID=87229 RepID=A0A4Z1KY26_9HELO|nr:hypothetical protein BPOR_0107g00130 [Botrytis porri]